MALIIRDDDLSYWSDPEELEELYAPLFDRGIKVSFAVIPFGVKMHHAGDLRRFYQETEAMPLGDNSEMTEWLKEKIARGQAEVMLHGYNHLYSVEVLNGKEPATRSTMDMVRSEGEVPRLWGEFSTGTAEELALKISKGKKYLETLLDCRIRIFVPPSNQIGREGILAVVRNGLHISGLIGKVYNREWSVRGLVTFGDRILFALRHRGLTYPKVANYGKHKELTGYAWTPSTDAQGLQRQFAYCVEHGYPFQIATHYWELQGELKAGFYQLVDHALEIGLKSRFLGEVL
ncbi:DUF2334 domain-containing protein [Nitratifractor sp.]